MKIIAIDTSTELSSIALLDSGTVISQASHTDARGHVEAIGTLFAELELDRNALPDLIACGVGPGPYTGLRVGIAFAQGLSAAWSVPVVGVCSLDAVANSIIRQGLVAPESEFIAATDARRKEFYWAKFDGSGKRISGPSVDLIEVVEALAREADIPLLTQVLPHAIDIAACAARGDRLDVTPMYLREADAKPSAPVTL
jgi:tRNA threonylcarbamoyl adenosine modification protein YeaZ